MNYNYKDAKYGYIAIFILITSFLLLGSIVYNRAEYFRKFISIIKTIYN
jgi:hypothetical protein